MSQTVIFFGSGPVARASLEHLAAEFQIEYVITKRRPAHHKDPAPVEEFAKTTNLKLLFADTKAELEQVIIATQPASTCGIVIDYGVIISQAVIDYFPCGIVNSHFSILPEWRGADPISFSILSGQTQTGVSLMAIDAGLDTGPLIGETYVDVLLEDTGSSLTTVLVEASNALLSSLLPSYIDGMIVTVPQDTTAHIPTYSRKLTKQDGIIDTSKPASVLEREIRAFDVWPRSKYSINDSLTIIVTKARVSEQTAAEGELVITDDKKLCIGTRVGSLEIIELMPLGKQKMDVAAFINGYGSRLSAS